MDSLPQVPHSLAPGSQTVCYLPWLKVSVALRYVRTFPWAAEAWREVWLAPTSHSCVGYPTAALGVMSFGPIAPDATRLDGSVRRSLAYVGFLVQIPERAECL